MIRKISEKSRLVNKYLYGFLAITFCLLYGNAHAAQEGISIAFNNELLTEVLVKLEKISGYSFAYQSDILPANYRITKAFKNKSIERILSDVLKGTGVSFQIVDKHIILKKKVKRKKYTLSGYVGDAKTGQKLINVNVYDKESNSGTISNNYGHFNLTLEEGVYNIVFSYIGMHKMEKLIVFDKDKQLNIELNPNLEIEEVIVKGLSNKPLIDEETPIGKMNVSPIEMSKYPVLMTEPDLVKYIQLLPGMQSGMEANGALYVRGGSSSQNLFLIDNTPIYNSYHLLGLFSVFNADMIGATDVYKGGFPARYGGRLSSVIDMKTKDGNFKELKGKISLGLISSKLFLEGPLIKDKTSFALSGRFGYYYLYGNVIPSMLTDGNELQDYYFGDINAKVTHKFSNNSKIYASFYSGTDFGETIETFENNYTENELHLFENTDGQNWYNMLGTIGWQGKILKKLFSNIQLTVSSYNYLGYLNDSTYHSTNNDISSTFKSNRIENSVLNKSIISDFQLELSPKIKINFGYKYSVVTFISQNGTKDHFTNNQEQSYSYYNDTTTNYYLHNTDEQNAYVDFNISLTKNLNFSAGLHSSFYNTDNYSNISFQPRANASWEFIPGYIIKGAYSQMVQHLHYLEATKIKRASDLLVAAVKDAPSETSEHYSVGLSFLKFKHLNFHLEAYYKTMDNLINFKEGASYFTQSDSWEEKVVSGIGDSKGLELLIEKPMGKLSGWIGYTIAKTNRQFTGINMEQAFPFRFEHRHHLNILAKYQLSKKWSLSVNWLFHTGNKETVSDVFYWSTNELLDIRMNFDYEAEKLHYNQKNAYINPNYHRLDLAINYSRKNRLGKATWSFSVYNLYNRKNVYSSSYDEEYAHFVGNIGYNKRFIKQHNLFGIIPSISYSLNF